MRIVAGRYRGRPITAPKTDGVRPTLDRVRQAVFNVLAHGIDGFSLQDARVIDLFAGSGALGLEAASRGAAQVIFVETASPARAAIRENIERLGIGGMARILKRDATDLGPSKSATADNTLAFLDPPYGRQLAEAALEQLARGGWLAPGAIVVIEEDRLHAVTLPLPYEEVTRRNYGQTEIVIARFSAENGTVRSASDD